jgi:hypothetical protein
MKRSAFDFAESRAQCFEGLSRLLERRILPPEIRRLVIDLLVAFLVDLISDGGDYVLNFGGNSIAFGALRTA